MDACAELHVQMGIVALGDLEATVTRLVAAAVCAEVDDLKRLARVLRRIIDRRDDLEFYLQPPDHITVRELEVVYLAAVVGLTNRAIADELVISVKTVEAHRAHVATKCRLSRVRSGFHDISAAYWRELGREEGLVAAGVLAAATPGAQ